MHSRRYPCNVRLPHPISRTLGWSNNNARVRENCCLSKVGNQKLEIKTCRRPVSLPRIDWHRVRVKDAQQRARRRRGKPNLELQISLAGRVCVRTKTCVCGKRSTRSQRCSQDEKHQKCTHIWHCISNLSCPKTTQRRTFCPCFLLPSPYLSNCACSRVAHTLYNLAMPATTLALCDGETGSAP
jgi:hypothetical protein